MILKKIFRIVVDYLMHIWKTGSNIYQGKRHHWDLLIGKIWCQPFFLYINQLYCMKSLKEKATDINAYWHLNIFQMIKRLSKLPIKDGTWFWQSTLSKLNSFFFYGHVLHNSIFFHYLHSRLSHKRTTPQS